MNPSMDSNKNLAGRRVAIVTGGAIGLGRAIVQRLAQDRVAVVIADRDMAAAQELAAGLSADGAQVVAVGTDVLNNVSMDALVATTLKQFGQIDYLVNNAGMLGPIKPFWESSDEEFTRVYDLNVRAVFACTRVVVRAMLERKSGSIVNIASVAGKDGPKDMSIYASSKSAVIGLTKSWGKELAPHGIRVNCISPSLIEASTMKNEMPDWFVKDSISRIPMGRAASTQEVANIVNFLLSDEAGFVTGTCYDVSGGRASY